MHFDGRALCGPAERAYSASQTLNWIKGRVKGKEGTGKRSGRGQKRNGEGRGLLKPPLRNPTYATDTYCKHINTNAKLFC